MKAFVSTAILAAILMCASSEAGTGKTPAPPTPPAAVAPPAPSTPPPAPAATVRGEAQDVHRKVNASPDGTVTIVNPAGSVQVVGWERNEVQVSGSLGPFVRRMQFTRDGDRVELSIISRANFPLGDVADIEVHVPLLSRVDIRSFSASVEVSGVNGAVEIETMNGGIDVGGTPKLVHAECVSCSMDLSASADVIRAETVNGSIDASGARGFLELSSTSGSISLESAGAKEVTATTVSGSIEAGGTFDPASSLYFETHSGSISLDLPASIRADFDIQNYSGPIESEFSELPAAPITRRVSQPREMHFSTGGGGSHVQLKSFSGTISVGKQ